MATSGLGAWDDDCATVLQKFPVHLRNRIEGILVQHDVVGNVESSGDEETLPIGYGDHGSEPETRPAYRGAYSACQSEAPVASHSMLDMGHSMDRVPSLPKAAQLTPRSKQQHVSRRVGILEIRN